MTGTDALTQVGRDLVELADYAYGRLRDRVDGLSDDEYFWEPAPGCWSVRPGPDGVYRMDGDEAEPDPDPTPLTTIAWRICHIVDVLIGPHHAAWLGVAPPPEAQTSGEPATAQAAIRRLDWAYDRMRGVVSSVDSATLADPMGLIARRYAESTRMAFVLHLLDELIHHGAEVGTMRDVYRALRKE
jgi:hypothetical protein